MSFDPRQDLANFVFLKNYARFRPDLQRRETWNEASKRVMDMHRTKYGVSLADTVYDEVEAALKNKLILPSMRSFQFGGDAILRKNMRIFNCFTAEQTFVARGGVRSFNDCSDGDVVEVLTHTGAWRRAVVRNYGQREVNKITITRGRNRHTVVATSNHRWLLSNGTETTTLNVGDSLLSAPSFFTEFAFDDAPVDEQVAWAYGMVYGDGTRVKDNQRIRGSMIRLCGNDKRFVDRFLSLGFSASWPKSCGGDPIVYTGSYQKTPISLDEEPRLIRAFVRGYLDADGAKRPSGEERNPFQSIQVTGKEQIAWARRALPLAGVYIISEDSPPMETNFGPRSDDTVRFIISTYPSGATKARFLVSNIEPAGTAQTWCLEVEEDASFVLPFGVATGNCSYSFFDRPRFLAEAVWLLLCGTGVGFSVQKHHVAKLPQISPPGARVNTHYVEDSIEGWADAFKVLFESYFGYEATQGIDCGIRFDYSRVRPEGAPLSSSSAKAPGPKPLRDSLEAVRQLLDRVVANGGVIRPIDAYDMVMHSAMCVRAGGVRRSATIALFSPDDEDMMLAKTGNWFADNPQRRLSNNSALLVRATASEDEFFRLLDATQNFGEPGFFFSNSTEHGTNPCAEIGLAPVDERTGETGWAMCNLTSVNVAACPDTETFYHACNMASVLGTLQAGYTNPDYLGETSRYILERDSLLGVSLTGMADNPAIAFNETCLAFGAKLVGTTNRAISAAIGIRHAARLTTVKPEGTGSLALGVGNGVHPHHSRRYLRHVEGGKLTDPLVAFMAKYCPEAVVPSAYSQGEYKLVFPIDLGEAPQWYKAETSALDHLAKVKLVYEAWVKPGTDRGDLTHNVSNTIVVRPAEWKAVGDFVWANRQSFGGVAMLGSSGDLDYPQAPFVEVLSEEEIRLKYPDDVIRATKALLVLEQYRQLRLKWTALPWGDLREDTDAAGGVEVVACAGGACSF
jgi:ribonucleoside-diphosphate reductase alpha chain